MPRLHRTISMAAALVALEGVAADAAGNVYAGYTNKMNFRRFVRK